MTKKIQSVSIALLFCLLCVVTQADVCFPQMVVHEIPTPASEPRGLVWDGSKLWCADVEKDSVFKLDPGTGQVLSSIYFPFSIDTTDSAAGGLAWSDDENMWISHGSSIYKLNPLDGQLLDYILCPGGL